MSVDYSKQRQSTLRPASLAVKSGDVVVVWEHPELVNSDSDGWYLAEVLFCEDRACDSGSPSLLQIAFLIFLLLGYLPFCFPFSLCQLYKVPLTFLSHLFVQFSWFFHQV